MACPDCGGMYANNTKLFDHVIRQSAMEGNIPKCACLQQMHVLCPV